MIRTEETGFILTMDGGMEEVGPDDQVAVWHVPGLYDELAFAGYARTSDLEVSRFDGCIDLRTDGETVTVFTTGPAPRRHVLPDEVAEVFLRWYRANCADENPGGQ
ncbi:hypothetical protein [Micromonospora chalcea]|uniref:hypothetical protein n=1 Tax=Micromonospora chalcea TaxID=1874 RepID=UPI003D71C619